MYSGAGSMLANGSPCVSMVYLHSALSTASMLSLTVVRSDPCAAMSYSTQCATQPSPSGKATILICSLSSAGITGLRFDDKRIVNDGSARLTSYARLTKEVSISFQGGRSRNDPRQERPAS